MSSSSKNWFFSEAIVDACRDLKDSKLIFSQIRQKMHDIVAFGQILEN